MGEMFPPSLIAMVATIDGTIVNSEWPLYLIDPDKIEDFKEKFDDEGYTNTDGPGLVWNALTHPIDLRGPALDLKHSKPWR